jgi:hypothetical protein
VAGMFQHVSLLLDRIVHAPMVHQFSLLLQESVMSPCNECIVFYVSASSQIE